MQYGVFFIYFEKIYIQNIDLCVQILSDVARGRPSFVKNEESSTPTVKMKHKKKSRRCGSYKER